jgi:hypothetical protein
LAEKWGEKISARTGPVSPLALAHESPLACADGSDNFPAVVFPAVVKPLFIA